jgi:CsoR family transcriptional regulator, copper-sensing transcriptional repressor
MLTAEKKIKLDRRLARIEGQVAGLRRMLNEDRYCIDVLDQVSAARGALARVALAVLENHAHTCLRSALGSEDVDVRRQKVDELVKAFERHGRT